MSQVRARLGRHEWQYAGYLRAGTTNFANLLLARWYYQWITRQPRLPVTPMASASDSTEH